MQRREKTWRRRTLAGLVVILIAAAALLALSRSSKQSREIDDPKARARRASETAAAKRSIASAYEAGKRKDWKKSVGRLEAVANRPGNELADWAQYQKGIALKASGDYDRAVAAFRELQRRFPKSHLSLRAEALLREWRPARHGPAGEESGSPLSRAKPLGLCGAECLKIICDHYRVPARLGELAALSETKAEGATFSGLKKAAEAKGFQAGGKIGNLLYLAGTPKPCIVWVNGHHFVVVTRATEKAIWILDPASREPGPQKLPARDFLRRWAGHTLEVTLPSKWATRE